MSAASGKVALVAGTSPLTGACPTAGAAGLRRLRRRQLLRGHRRRADAVEHDGGRSARTPASPTRNDNAADFVTDAPSPKTTLGVPPDGHRRRGAGLDCQRGVVAADRHGDARGIPVEPAHRRHGGPLADRRRRPGVLRRRLARRLDGRRQRLLGSGRRVRRARLQGAHRHDRRRARPSGSSHDPARSRVATTIAHLADPGQRLDLAAGRAVRHDDRDRHGAPQHRLLSCRRRTVSDDGDPATSEGVFVFTSGAPMRSRRSATRVRVSGVVSEFAPAPPSPPLTELGGGPVFARHWRSGSRCRRRSRCTSADTSPAGRHRAARTLRGHAGARPTSCVIAPDRRHRHRVRRATPMSNGEFYGVLTGSRGPVREPGLDPCVGSAARTCPAACRGSTATPSGCASTATAQTGRAAARRGRRSAHRRTLTGVLDFAFGSYTILPDPGRRH